MDQEFDSEICREAIISNNYMDFLVEYGGDLETLQNQYDFACIQVINYQYAVVHLQSEVQLENLNNSYRSFPKCLGLMDSSNMEVSGILRMQRLPSLNLRGRGVIVGIVDTGIDYTNSLFRQADGTTRIASIWDQGIQTGNPPEGFFYGSEYTREQINEALASEGDPHLVVPTEDTQGHGTFLAGIAAGGEDIAQDFIGAAPDATIVAVKLKEAKPYLKNFFQIPQDALAYQSTDLMLGIRYLLDVAQKLRMPIAICIGIGNSQGSRDGTGTLNNFLSDYAKVRGIAICISAGNESQTGHHYYGTIPEGSHYDSVEINVGETDGFTLELWGGSPSIFSVAIRSPSGEVIPRIPPRIGTSRVINLLLEQTRLRIDYQLVERASGDELISIIFEKPTKGIWTIDVYEDGPLAGGFHMWLPIRNFLSEDTAFLRPDPNTTIVTPSDAISPIGVATYNHYNDSIYINSSRGFGRNNMIKPDITAPGVNIYGPNLRGGYSTRSGSSIAAAHVTGAAALMLEWGIQLGNEPFLNSVQIKKYLIRGAGRNTELTYPNREWGYGKLDLYQAFRQMIL